jgi:hypothetical protein
MSKKYYNISTDSKIKANLSKTLKVKVIYVSTSILF